MQELERADSGLRSQASVQGALAIYAIHSFGTPSNARAGCRDWCRANAWVVSR